MRRAWPALPAAFLVGASVYGLLAAVRPAVLPVEDPWLEAWTRAGLQAQFRSAYDAPHTAYMDKGARATLKLPEHGGARLREYDVAGFKAQVLEFPASAQGSLAGFVAEDSWKSGDGCHARRAGRRVLALARKRWVTMFEVFLPKEERDRIFTVFRDAAGSVP